MKISVKEEEKEEEEKLISLNIDVPSIIARKRQVLFLCIVGTRLFYEPCWRILWEGGSLSPREMLPNNGKAWQTSATANIILLMHGQLALKREQRGNVCLFARIMRIKHSCLIQRNVLRFVRFQFPFHFGFLMDNNPSFLRVYRRILNAWTKGWKEETLREEF